MSLDVSLRNALAGLNVAQRGMDVVSRNISNTDTPDYTRKIARQETQVVNGVQYGVQVTGIEREVDYYLQREVFNRESLVAGLGVKEQFLQRIEGLHGKPDSADSLASQLNRLRDGFVKLVDDPASTVAQRQVIDQAASLATTFNQLSRALNDLRNEANQQILSGLAELNGHLARVDDINKNVTASAGLGIDQPDLEDKRDAALRAISQLVDVQTYRRGDGSYAVLTERGFGLLESGPVDLGMVSQRLGSGDYYETNIVDPADPTGPIRPPADTTPAPPAPNGTIHGILSNNKDVTAQMTGGRIGALIELRDSVLPQMEAQLDELAQELAQRFSMAGVRLFADGDTTVPLDGTEVGFAGRIGVPQVVVDNPRLLRDGTGWHAAGGHDPDAGLFVGIAETVALADPPPTPPASGGGADGPGTPGDSSVIRNLIAKVFEQASPTLHRANAGPPPSYTAEVQGFDTTGLGPGDTLSSGLPAGLTLGAYAGEMVTWLAEARSRTTASLESTTEIRDHFQKRLSDQSGVNLDEEISLLVQLQRSYSSSARVISTNREMFSELLQTVG
jgi:flagellar hook-associated protein 1 FlgK